MWVCCYTLALYHLLGKVPHITINSVLYTTLCWLVALLGEYTQQSFLKILVPYASFGNPFTSNAYMLIQVKLQSINRQHWAGYMIWYTSNCWLLLWLHEPLSALRIADFYCDYMSCYLYFEWCFGLLSVLWMVFWIADISLFVAWSWALALSDSLYHCYVGLNMVHRLLLASVFPWLVSVLSVISAGNGWVRLGFKTALLYEYTALVWLRYNLHTERCTGPLLCWFEPLQQILFAIIFLVGMLS